MPWRGQLICEHEPTLSRCRVSWLLTFATLVLVLVASLIGTKAHALPESAKFPGVDKNVYPITNSAYQGYTFGSTTVAWVDNDRVLFLSSGPLLKSGEPRRSGSLNLYLWNTRSGDIAKYAASVSGFCYAEGMVRFWSKHNQSYVEYTGRLDQEQERAYAKVESRERSGSRLNPLTCEYYRDDDLPKAEGLVFQPLRTGDGYLGGGSPAGSNFTLFLPGKSHQYQKIPVPTRTETVGYSELLHAYVLREAPPISVRDSKLDLRFWLFRPENKGVEPLVIPSGAWLKGYIPFVRPTPVGIVFASHAAGKPDREGRPTTGAGGIYLLVGTQVKRIMAGYPYRASISPNGCRVVASIATRGMADEPAAVKFVDLCV